MSKLTKDTVVKYIVDRKKIWDIDRVLANQAVQNHYIIRYSILIRNPTKISTNSICYSLKIIDSVLVTFARSLIGIALFFVL